MTSVLFYFYRIPMNVSNLFSRWGALAAVVLALLTLSGCEVERRKSDAELGLTPQQADGRKL
jgi:hypothetical protein